jgi:protein-S-isoprenylcysteine O-methyltransferase Ste14
LANLEFWFHDPFRIQQLVSWFLLCVSLIAVICGVYYLRIIGKPNLKRSDPTLIGIEKTTQLVTEGVYRYIRHPMYSSLLFLAWGAFLKHISWVSILSTSLATLFLIATAKREEIENIRFFGSDYQGYMKRTRMFIPFLF